VPAVPRPGQQDSEPDHDFAAPRAGAFLDYDKIAVQHAGVDHGIAPDAQGKSTSIFRGVD